MQQIMKNISKFILAFAALALASVSCVKEEAHEPGPKDVEGCYGVYFPSQEATGDHVLTPLDPTVAEFTVARKNTSGAIEVPYTISGDTDVITGGKIAFADGQSETTLTLEFPTSKTGTKYAVSVTIDDEQYVSHYGDGTISFDYSVMRVEYKYFMNPKTNEPAQITFAQSWWDETHIIKLKYYEVDGVRYCTTETLDTDGKGFWNTKDGVEWSLIWYTNIKDNDGRQIIEIPAQYTGYHHSNYDADVYVYDYYHYWKDLRGEDVGTFPEFAKKYGADYTYPLSYYDGNGGFYLIPMYYYMTGIGGWSVGEVDMVGIAEGYVRVDYTLEVEADYTHEGALPLYFGVGADVATLAIAAFEGELSPAQVKNKMAEMEAGSVEGVVEISTEEFEEDEDGLFYGATEIQFEKTSLYTIAVLAKDKDGNVQESASVVANVIAAADEEDHAVKVTVGTEATSPRYTGVDGTNSFGFYVVGEDLTEVHYGVVATAKFKANPEAYYAAIKAADAVSEDVLAQINGVGGYASIFSELTALTNYTVLVWASNGDLETVVTANWTTDGLPNEVYCDKGYFTYSGYWRGSDPEQIIEYNPNSKLYEMPDWGGGVTFTFAWDKTTNVVTVQPGKIGANYSSYGAVYVGELTDIVTEAYLEKYEIPADTHSYYDPETKTFHFANVYFVSAGILTDANESYTEGEMPETTSAASVKLNSVSAPSKVAFNFPCEMNTPFDGRVSEISYQREPQAVSFKLSEVRPCEKRASNKNSEITVL